MAELDTKARNDLPEEDFALSGRRYPVPDAFHAKNAKARASQELAAGKLSRSEKAAVDSKADEVLFKSGFKKD